MEFFLEPLQYRFFQHGLWVAFLTGSLCGLLGVYIVLRQMSYIGHGLAHAVFGGAIASFLLNLNFYLGAGSWGMLAVILIDTLAAKREIRSHRFSPLHKLFLRLPSLLVKVDNAEYCDEQYDDRDEGPKDSCSKSVEAGETKSQF